ncbi:sigma D regulator [Thalassotalea agarivorans]|uniref:Regulator of sigma D n=1 Tax=Thalassotalea agarivorans TaxID=349064 RepID=A0A1I0CC03_THASX|nr:sigma D regulator [Thalassotalea agarivorans]SET17047.1 regulator of sigma D [Thalassotalea agarivorans]
MLTRVEQAQRQWGGANNVIDKWLADRQAMLVAYTELAGLPPYQRQDSALPSVTEIKHFCQLLVDYICAGHFEVFETIKAQTPDKSQDIAEILDRVYYSTDAALQFNDKYTQLNDTEILEGFDDALSRLVQYLDKRFELEDKLIGFLLKHD